jgi:hypothetical protein
MKTEAEATNTWGHQELEEAKKTPSLETPDLCAGVWPLQL